MTEEEIFVVQAGSVTFTAGDDVIEASGGHGVPMRSHYASAHQCRTVPEGTLK